MTSPSQKTDTGLIATKVTTVKEMAKYFYDIF